LEGIFQALVGTGKMDQNGSTANRKSKIVMCDEAFNFIPRCWCLRQGHLRACRLCHDAFLRCKPCAKPCKSDAHGGYIRDTWKMHGDVQIFPLFLIESYRHTRAYLLCMPGPVHNCATAP
jgi:hypothetical protein